MRVLIADDDRVMTAILAKTLPRWDLEGVVAHDGNAAWDLLKADAGPSLAIIDWMMPGLDGLELCRRIRHDPALMHVYVILLTGRHSRADLVAGLDAGADDYIVKPFDVEELRARVHVGIRVRALQERLSEQIAELQIARDHLARLAHTDVLTGLSSRRRWFEIATIELGRSRRYRHPLALLLIDLDFFKRINDTFGHDVGDDVLKRFAEMLRLSSRTSDVLGRMGGEEFAVLLPETSLTGAREVASRIVEQCRSLEVQTPSGRVSVSCSVGIAEASEADDTVATILRRADAALYRAKGSGRDRVEMSDSAAVTAPAMR